MKEFKKWFDKKKKLLSHRPPNEIDCGLGFRAALEWVMRTGMGHYGNDFLSMDLCKDIREELGDT